MASFLADSSTHFQAFPTGGQIFRSLLLDKAEGSVEKSHFTLQALSRKKEGVL